MTEKKNILIIDDEERIGNLVKQGLEGLGDFDVSTAVNGLDGLAMARKIKPHLIFLDICMPGISGVEVLKRLKKNKDTQHIPVVLLTAALDSSARAECSTLYAGYLEKPVGLSVLKNKIEEILK